VFSPQFFYDFRWSQIAHKCDLQQKSRKVLSQVWEEVNLRLPEVETIKPYPWVGRDLVVRDSSVEAPSPLRARARALNTTMLAEVLSG